MRPAFRHVLLATLELPEREPELVVLDTAAMQLLRFETPHAGELHPLSYVVVEHEQPPAEADPARPDLRVAKAVQPTERVVRRRHLVTWLAELAASERRAPLGIPGPSVPYGRFDGEQPSLSVLGLHGPLVARRRDGTAVLEFTWGSTRQAIALAPELAARLGEASPSSPSGWRSATRRVPRFAVAAFAPPEHGYCRKLVVALI